MRRAGTLGTSWLEYYMRTSHSAGMESMEDLEPETQILSKKWTASTLQKPNTGESVPYYLLLVERMHATERGARKRSASYRGWLALCRINTEECTGFLIYPCQDTICSNPILPYVPSQGGTKTLGDHPANHQQSSKSVKYFDTQAKKARIKVRTAMGNAAAMAIFISLYPLRWTEQRAEVSELALACLKKGSKLT